MIRKDYQMKTLTNNKTKKEKNNGIKRRFIVFKIT